MIQWQYIPVRADCLTKLRWDWINLFFSKGYLSWAEVWHNAAVKQYNYSVAQKGKTKSKTHYINLRHNCTYVLIVLKAEDVVAFTNPWLLLFLSSCQRIHSQVSGKSVLSSLHWKCEPLCYRLLYKWAPAKRLLYVNELFPFKGNIFPEGHNTMHYSSALLMIILNRSLYICACLCVLHVRVDVSIFAHLGLKDIKRSTEATRHCCLATATIPLVFCCHGTAVQISL